MSGLSIILRSDRYEDAHYALAMASAALAVNQSAVLFFTMGGLRALMKPPQLQDWSRDATNRERGVGDFETLLQACIELGARFIVCEMGLRSLAFGPPADLRRARRLVGGDGDRQAPRLPDLWAFMRGGHS